MEKLANFFNRHKKVIGISAAATLAIGTLYLLTRKSGSSKSSIKGVQNNTSVNPEKNNTDGSNLTVGEEQNKTAYPTDLKENTVQGDPAYFSKAKTIAKKIRVEKIGATRTYNLSTISQILEQSIELAEEDFIEVTKKNRKERRKLMQSDVEGYEKYVVEYNDDVENVLKKGQQALLEILGIPYEDFEESVIDFMEKGHYQEIYMFQAAIRQKIKEKVQSTSDISIEKTKEIIRFQIEILNQQPELLKQLIQKLSASQETVQLIPSIITNLLNDYIYNEFKVEEEDQMKVFSRPDIAQDHEIVMLLQEIEQAMFSLMMPFGSGMGDF